MSSNEKDRLLELERYTQPDLVRDARIQEITRLTAVACSSPMAMTAFIDSDHLRIKSQFGFEAKEIRREEAFCNHTIELGETLVVPDASIDRRFQNSRFVSKAPHIRFYAGTPLTSADGSHLGSLCVMDTKPKDLLAHEKALLERLARLIMLEYQADKEQNKTNAAIRVSASRFNSVGDLAAGITHEISNPLTIIKARLSLLRRDAQNGKLSSDQVVQSAGKMEKVLDRINEIIQGLNSFVTRTAPEPIRSIKVEELIEDVLTFMTDRVRELGIDLQIDDKNLNRELSIKCRPIQLVQAISNLIVNACHAVENTEERWIKIRFKQFETRLQIRISDSGSKIENDVIEKLFRPYFTTKPGGKGTGLGLSMSRAFVEAVNGSLFLEQNDREKAFVIELDLV